MTFTPHFMPQRSAAWYAARVGLLTGSVAEAILAVRKTGSGELAKRADLRRRLVSERITGLSEEDPYVSPWMERGLVLEAEAFAAYEAATGQIVQRVGFVTHNTLKVGCSPDGFIGEWEGILELKVPKSTTHLGYLQAAVLPDRYRAQCLHAIWLTGAQWCDFCSFDPRYPEALELFRVRVEPTDAEIASYELLVLQFLAEVEREVEHLQPRRTDGEEEDGNRQGDRSVNGGDLVPTEGDRHAAAAAGQPAEAEAQASEATDRGHRRRVASSC